MLENMLNNSETKLGRYFAFFIQSLIIFSLITFSVDTLPNLSTTTKNTLGIIEAVVVVIFTIEYLLTTSPPLKIK